MSLKCKDKAWCDEIRKLLVYVCDTDSDLQSLQIRKARKKDHILKQINSRFAYMYTEWLFAPPLCE